VCSSVFFAGEISPDGELFFKNANFGDFFQKLIFLSPKISSDLTIFHPLEQFFIRL
jgi:hypothetical protein